VTHVAANGQKTALKVEYRFIGRKTFALETCQFDVIQYTSRSVNLADGQEVSFVEGEYSPDLKITLGSRTRLTAEGKMISLVITARKLYVGTANFIPAGKASPAIGPSKMVAAPPTSLELSVASLWKYIQAPVTPGRIFAHGQTDIADQHGAWLGGIGFYCALPHPYIDIFVHKPGGTLTDYYWGNASLKTSLELDGIKMPATIERGIIYIDVSDEIRPALEKVFEFKPGASNRALNVDVANFAKFSLIVKANNQPPAAATTDLVSFARMVGLCDTTIAAQPRGK